MTFGLQTSEKEAHKMLDLAFERGVNFIDTAEMYPAPASETGYGESERIIGNWLARHPNRNEIVVATKAAGPGAFVKWIRGGRSGHNRTNLRAALEASLTRLRTDYIDLFQLHWPDRAANYFGQLGYKPATSESRFSIEQTLEALAEFVDEGLVRAVGVCNETAWGIHRFMQAGTAIGMPGIASIQNPYNLLNRTLEIGIAEFASRESVPVLAYSPLAFGMLTGKYFGGTGPEEARLNRFKHYKRYRTAKALEAARRYCELGNEHQIEPAALAIAWVRSKPYVGSVIIGASNAAQLETNISSADTIVSPELARAIDEIHHEIPNPCP